MDCSLPGSSVHGILQARILECVTMPSSKGSSQPRDWTQVSVWQVNSLLSEPPGKAQPCLKYSHVRGQFSTHSSPATWPQSTSHFTGEEPGSSRSVLTVPNYPWVACLSEALLTLAAQRKERLQWGGSKAAWRSWKLGSVFVFLSFRSFSVKEEQ